MVLPELEVTDRTYADAFSADMSQPVSEALDAIPILHWLPRGTGAQADISIRGSRFSGAGFSVSGLSLRNVFNEDLQLYPGQPSAGRHLLATCSVRW